MSFKKCFKICEKILYKDYGYIFPCIHESIHGNNYNRFIILLASEESEKAMESSRIGSASFVFVMFQLLKRQNFYRNLIKFDNTRMLIVLSSRLLVRLKYFILYMY